MGVIVREPELCDPEFLFRWFESVSLSDFSNPGPLPSITAQAIKNIEILLPSLPEQRAIARVLRTVQEAKEVRRREAALEREHKAALMQNLFTNGIDSAVKGSRETQYGILPACWHVVPLHECAHVQTGVAKGRNLDGEATQTLPYLRVANVQNGYLDLSEMKTITIRESEKERYSLHDGDVVLTEGGDFDKLGRGFLWEGQVPNCVHQNHVFAVRAKQKILLPRYLAYLIQSEYGRAYFLSVAHKTTNLACINSAKLKAFPTALPEIEEQKAIVAALDACDATIRAVENESRFLEELFRAMLEELMTGRLTTILLVDAKAIGHSQEKS